MVPWALFSKMDLQESYPVLQYHAIPQSRHIEILLPDIPGQTVEGIAAQS